MKIFIAIFAIPALSACVSPPVSSTLALTASASRTPYDYTMYILSKW